MFSKSAMYKTYSKNLFDNNTKKFYKILSKMLFLSVKKSLKSFTNSLNKF